MAITNDEMVELYQDEDFCPLCASGNRARGLAPNILVTLPTRTEQHGNKIQVCPECDGGVAQLGMR